MIDFDKLKLAHELCESMDSLYFDISLGMDEGVINLYDANKENQLIYDTESIDDLIAKLQELSSLKPKYEINNYIWIVLEDNAPHHKKIINRYLNDGEYIYVVTDLFGASVSYEEDSFFLTKKALIDYQIEYWQSLQCEHPSDDRIYTSNPPYFKCKKCGEFYR